MARDKQPARRSDIPPRAPRGRGQTSKPVTTGQGRKRTNREWEGDSETESAGSHTSSPPQAPPPISATRSSPRTRPPVPIRSPTPSHASASRYMPYFQNAEASKRYTEQYVSRPLSAEKYVDFAYLKSKGMDFEMLCVGAGFVALSEMKCEIYPTLVRMFYSNLKDELIGNSRVVSFVKGKEIVLDKTVLASILSVGNSGVEHYDDIWCHNDQCDRRSAYMKLYKVDEIDDVRVEAPIPFNLLDLEMRILHKIVIGVVHPRIGTRSKISTLDACLMGCVVERKPINIGSFMLRHMVYSNRVRKGTKRNSQGLPYAMALTKIFQSFGVDLSNETSVKMNMSADAIDEKAIVRMGYKWNQTRQTFVNTKKDMPAGYSDVPEIEDRVRGRTFNVVPMSPPAVDSEQEEEDFVHGTEHDPSAGPSVGPSIGPAVGPSFGSSIGLSPEVEDFIRQTVHESETRVISKMEAIAESLKNLVKSLVPTCGKKTLTRTRSF